MRRYIFGYAYGARRDKVLNTAYRNERMRSSRFLLYRRREYSIGMSGKESYYSNIGKLNDIEFDGDSYISEALLPEKVGYYTGKSVYAASLLKKFFGKFPKISRSYYLLGILAFYYINYD